jgi:hypothetical protein
MSVESSHAHPELAFIPAIKLWFGLIASAIAWLVLGATDLLIVWKECAHQQLYAGEGAHPASGILLFVNSVVLFAIAVAAGTVSYHNWRTLSHANDLLATNATDRREFMALLGVIISVTLGMGIIWLSIPPLMIQLCERAK